MDIALFVFKVFLLSLGLSIAIKYGGPFLNIEPTPLNALIAVISPSVIFAIVLLVQSKSSSIKE